MNVIIGKSLQSAIVKAQVDQMNDHTKIGSEVEFYGIKAVRLAVNQYFVDGSVYATTIRDVKRICLKRSEG